MGAGYIWITILNTTGCKPAVRTQEKSTLSSQPEHAWTRHSQPTQPATEVQRFRSRPDLSPPVVEVSTRAHDTAPGYIFVAPKMGGPGQGGSMILDDRGQPVWFRPMTGAHLRAMDFKVQKYRGRSVLTWGESRVVDGHRFNEYVILDSFYRELTRVRAGNGYQGDHHEFLITPQNTALLTIYHRVPMDLSSVGGQKDGAVVDGIAQEVDIETGEVLFEWHSLEHVDLDESYLEPGKGPRKHFDYFHINSIDIDHDDNLLVSARNTSTVYKVDRKSGEVMWRLGGKKSDFAMGPGTRTAYQHDARRQKDGTITIFDNGTTIFDNGPPKAVEESRGIVLELDMDKMTASLLHRYTHPGKQYADAAGNMQMLPNGNVLVGWGRAMVFSEFSSEGELLFSASLPPKNLSYRVFRFPWSGRPRDQPAVALEARSSEDEVTVYASWNGATEVTSWQVLAGPSPNRLKPVSSAPRSGFETAIAVRTSEPYIGVRAKDRSGRVLGTAKAVESRK